MKIQPPIIVEFVSTCTVSLALLLAPVRESRCCRSVRTGAVFTRAHFRVRVDEALVRFALDRTVSWDRGGVLLFLGGPRESFETYCCQGLKGEK